MKRTHLRQLMVLLAMVFATTVAQAENYPYRGDFLWVVNANHSDRLYKTGEDAIFEVQLYHYGIPANAKVEYEIAPELLAPTKKGTMTIKDGKGTVNIGTRKTPGFQSLTMTTTIDGVKSTHHVKAGFSVDKITPYTKEPKDFMDFWNSTLNEMHKTPLSYTRELAKEYCTDKIDCWLIKLRIDKIHYMYAYLTMPKDAQKGKCPAVFCPPGAGIKTIKEPLRHKYYAENGFIRLEAEIHGLNPTLSEETFKEIQSGFAKGEGTYFNIGISNKELFYMRHVYAGMVRCLDFIASLPEWDGKNLITQGGSQGGALSMVGAALDKRVTQCVVNHPALTDMAGYMEKGRTGGYPHYNHTPGLLNEQTEGVLAYYDVINMCRHITCPVRMTWGYDDNTCPPTTSYAAWNTLTGKKEAVITPINEHWVSDALDYQHMEWIKKNLK